MPTKLSAGEVIVGRLVAGSAKVSGVEVDPTLARIGASIYCLNNDVDSSGTTFDFDGSDDSNEQFRHGFTYSDDNKKLVVPVTGRYRIEINLYVNSLTETDPYYMQATIYPSHASVVPVNLNGPLVASGGGQATLLVELAAGTEVRPRLISHSVSSINVGVVMLIQYVGPATSL